jgi:hypothetical protein
MSDAFSDEMTSQSLLTVASAFSGPNPVGLVTAFYCPRFETFLFVASYDLHCYGGGIQSHLLTGLVIFII